MILTILFLIFGFNSIGFFLAYYYQTDRLTDAFYALSFVIALISLASVSSLQAPQIVLALLIFAWAIRLGSFLGIRVHKKGRDARFDNIRNKFGTYLGFWMMQALSVYLILAPTQFFFIQPQVEFTFISFLGFMISIGSLIIEAVADEQKRVYRLHHPDRWIDKGLWCICRHPNYLGEIGFWLGVYLFVWSSLPAYLKLAGLISPAYIFFLLRFVSGIPILEKKGQDLWGKDEAYQAYLKKVPGLWPSKESIGAIKNTDTFKLNGM